MSLTDSIDRLEAELGNRFDRLVRGLNDEIRRRIDQGQQELVRQLEQVSSELPVPLLSREDLDPLTLQARTEGHGGGLAEGRQAAQGELLDALRAFDAAAHQADLLDALLDRTARHAARTGLFLTRAAGARFWAGRGWGESEAAMSGLELAWDEDGAWARLAAAAGPVELRSAECAALCSRIESPLPQEAVWIPLVLRDRVAAALYADRGEGDAALDLPALQALTYCAALCIESLPFRERTATPTLAAAGEAAVALPLWDTAPPAEAAPEAPVDDLAPVAEEAVAEAPEAELDEAPSEAPDEPEVALAMEAMEAPEAPPEPAAEPSWSYVEPSEPWQAPPPAEEPDEEPARGATAELAPEAVFAGTSAIEDGPWPVAEPAAEEPVPEPPAEPAWPAMADADAWPAPEPESVAAAGWPEPAAPTAWEAEPEPAAWAPVEDELAPPPEYTTPPAFVEEDLGPAYAPPAAETVLLDRSAFGGGFEPAPPVEVPQPPPPAPLPDEREETRPGLAGSAQVMPPSDFSGPGWAFSTSRLQAPAAGAVVERDEAAHEEARRLARLLVSEIRLYNEDQVDEGRRQRNLYDRLRDDIERSRQLYNERIDPRVGSVDYFDQELVRILAGGDAEALGR